MEVLEGTRSWHAGVEVQDNNNVMSCIGQPGRGVSDSLDIFSQVIFGWIGVHDGNFTGSMLSPRVSTTGMRGLQYSEVQEAPGTTKIIGFDIVDVV